MFHMSLLEQEITKKGQMKKYLVPEFETSNNKEYKVKGIRDSTVYAKEADKHLPELYYLIV